MHNKAIKLTTNQVLTVTKSDSGEIVCSAPKEFDLEATEPFIESTSRSIIGRKVDVLDTEYSPDTNEN